MCPLRKNQRGQVLVLGVFILLILLVAIFVGFDVYNAVRAKFKLETGEESAALSAASWQCESLNLIGEINLIKACSALMEGDEHWDVPLPERRKCPGMSDEAFAARRAAMLQQRFNVLTEMQSRVAFIGPLVGFAAAQQAAKANGIPSRGTLDDYLELLDYSSRYRPELGGAPEVISGYRWKQPYMNLLRTISDNGIAVFPNARLMSSSAVYPPQLSRESFYDAIRKHLREIKAADGQALYPQSSWDDATRPFVENDPWAERFANPPWWSINAQLQSFPQESEIFALGVATSASSASEVFSFNEKNHLIPRRVVQVAEKKGFGQSGSLYPNDESLPAGVRLDWFCYDDTWYPQWYRQHYSDYQSEHFDYWFSGSTLRRAVRRQYQYEGPAAYVESYVDVGHVSGLFRVSGQLTTATSDGIGSGALSSGDGDSDERAGVIAKPLGSLPENKPPIEIPLVMPVFDQCAVMPTYMPIPYGFGVLRPGSSDLEKFLSWLATKQTLADDDPQNPLPSGCEKYLYPLQELVKGPEFRYYGWNPGFNAAAFASQWQIRLPEWHRRRLENPDLFQYSLKGGRTLPGWFQEPALFYNSSAQVPKKQLADAEKGITVPDNINGGSAVRYYYSQTSYFVVNGKGEIVTNGYPDPTRNYNSIGGSGGGSGYGNHGSRYDGQKGKPRL